MNRETWINEAFAELIKAMGPCENLNEQKNLREWAEAIAETYFDEEPAYTPHDAVWEELSYA